MSRFMSFSLLFACLGVTTLTSTTAKAGSCSINCGDFGGCEITAKNAVKCKCTPYPVCKRIWAIQVSTIEDLTSSAEENLAELDAQIVAAVDLELHALADVLETMRQAVLDADIEAYAAALADHDRLIQDLPAEPSTTRRQR